MAETLVEDIYVRLFRPKTTPGRLVLLSRLATILIAAIAFGPAVMALHGSALIDGMVAYAWNGLAASFGPPLLFSLWWRRTTWKGVLAGMVGGMVSTVIWLNSAALKELLDIKVACVIFSGALVVVLSLRDRPRD